MSKAPRAVTRWVVLGLLLFTLLTLLAVQGLSTRTTGRSATPVPGAGGPLAGDGPVLAWGPGGLQSRDVAPGRRIALTFDDGPDPRWTPRIAAVLRRLARARHLLRRRQRGRRHPDIVRAARRRRLRARQPHVHARRRSHACPGWQRACSSTLTESALAGTAGVRPRPFGRPTRRRRRGHAARRRARSRRSPAAATSIVLADFDGEDWRAPGRRRDRARRHAAGHGAAGSCSSTTAAATARRPSRRCGRIDPALRARGFRFVTVSRARGPRAKRGRAAGARWEPTARARPDRHARRRALDDAIARAAAAASSALLFVARVLPRARRWPGVTQRRVARRPPEPGFTPPVAVDRPGLQRGGRNRARRALARGQRLPRLRGRSSSTTARPTAPPRSSRASALDRRPRRCARPNRGKAGRAQPRHRRGERRRRRHGRCRHRFRAATRSRRSSQPLARPEVGARLGQHEGRQPRRAARPLAAHRVRDGLQPRPPHLRRAAAACRPFRGRSAPSGARRWPRSGGVSGATLAEDTDLTLAIGRAGLARRLRGERARLDRGAGDAARPLAPALPLVLRDAAGRLEASRALLAPRRARDRPPRPAVPRPLPDRAAAVRAADRPVRASTGSCSSTRCAVLGFWLAFNAPPAPARLHTRSGSTASRRGRSGRCRSSSSSTGS